MRILHAVEFYDPSVGGAQKVVKQVSEVLVQRGHEVTVATTELPERQSRTINGVQVVGFNAKGSLGGGLFGEVDSYQRFLLQSRFDVMMGYAAQQWTVDAAMGLVGLLPYASVLCPCGFSGLTNPIFDAYFQRLPGMLARYDRLIFHSDTYQDRAFCRRHGLEPISCTVPNAASEVEFQVPSDPSAFRKRLGIPTDVPLLLTVGSHTGLKGHAETLQAFARANIGRAALVVVGNPVPNGCQGKCHRLAKQVQSRSRGKRQAWVVDLPREQVIEAYFAADLFVFPSNIECSPLVLFECMAAGLPFLSSPAGNAEEIAQWSGSGDIVPSARNAMGVYQTAPKALAHAIEQALANPDRLAEQAAAGHAAWQARFCWQAVVDGYETAYHQAIEHHKHRRALQKHTQSTHPFDSQTTNQDTTCL